MAPRKAGGSGGRARCEIWAHFLDKGKWSTGSPFKKAVCKYCYAAFVNQVEGAQEPKIIQGRSGNMQRHFDSCPFSPMAESDAQTTDSELLSSDVVQKLAPEVVPKVEGAATRPKKRKTTASSDDMCNVNNCIDHTILKVCVGACKHTSVCVNV